jgi:hypothetical protein
LPCLEASVVDEARLRVNFTYVFATQRPFYALIAISEAVTTTTTRNSDGATMMGRLLPARVRKRDYTPYAGPKRRPGRPRKNFSTSSDAGNKSPSLSSKRLAPSIVTDIGKRQKKKKASQLSLLERLPVELLQNIFLESLNARLPCTSRVLATKLSSEHLQLEMSLLMLCTHREVIGQRERSKLLACRFFDYNFLLKFAHQAHNYFIGLPMTTKLIARGPDSLLQYDNNDSYTYHSGFQKFMTLMEVEDNRWCPQGLNNLFIPLKLLRGPWPRNKVWFLQSLVQRDCNIDLNSTGLEVALISVLEAIRTSDHDAILPIFLAGNYTGGLLPITHDMFRCAVLEGGCKRGVISTLLYPRSNVENMEMGERSRGLNFLDPDLWAWIERNRKDGNEENADWLQRVLETEGRCVEFTIDSNY